MSKNINVNPDHYKAVESPDLQRPDATLVAILAVNSDNSLCAAPCGGSQQFPHQL